MEHDEQAAFFDYCRWKNFPFVIAAVPNQRYAPNPATGRRFKREGVLAGFPDVGVFTARAGLHGLFLEFKWGKNRPSPEQKKVIELLRAAGYRVLVVYSATEAIKALEEYLNGA